MSLPSGYSIRELKASDHTNGILDVLSGLTTVGTVTANAFESIFKQWSTLKLSNGSNVYNPLVIVDSNGKVVATGMVFIEEKLIHSGGLVGHIEDIAVDSSQQGKSLGKFLIKELSLIAKRSGAYKVILDCSESNVKFYEKCGYKEAGVEMQIRYD
ncbi:hypothetical protein WICPIJ_003895 [Wickerhamomyces pijperi]|uniref:Glucosamine 6-phosphate N-acetyltransferase n=1 Tax=Wickerhamomyces pijperi TaxID=599730 RepID=A0A9P8TMK7_WICPI|nr:hypothetical protein WICPIJ_003895 [Wickerhamomyces pijperi]